MPYDRGGLTPERLELLAWAAGVSPRESDEWSWGELLCAVEGMQERLRQEGKAAALVAMRQAELTACALGGGKLPEVWEVFPFWSAEEVKERKVEKYRRVMERYAAGTAAGSPGLARKENRRE